MTNKFPQSKQLKELIESHGWTLYDISQSFEQGVKPEWNDLERQGPAGEFMFGGHYLFAPIPKEDQSLRDAYSVTKGLGPSLLIDDRHHERWRSLYVTSKGNTIYWKGREPSTGRIALFSRLSFNNSMGDGGEENVCAWTPDVVHPDPDFVAIRSHLALDTFQKYFRIVYMQGDPAEN